MTRPSKNADMTPTEIRISMLRHSGPRAQVRIAREAGVTQTAVYRTIMGRLTSHKLRSAIAEAAGLDVARVWPSTYIYGGGPKKRGRPRKRH